MPDLLQKMPPIEILDSATLLKLKQIAYKAFVASEHQQSASDCLVQLFTVRSASCEEFLADYLDHCVALVKETEKPVLQRRGMFRSKNSLTYFTYTLCMLLQQVSSFDAYSQFAQILTQ